MAGSVRKDSGSFFEKVFNVVRLIPFGRVTSYGAIAEYLGTRGSARMVGWAMHASHTQVTDVPAHRVVNRNGLLTGKHHFGSQNIMQQLLENEGIEVKDDKVIRFNELFWNPITELTMGMAIPKDYKTIKPQRREDAKC